MDSTGTYTIANELDAQGETDSADPNAKFANAAMTLIDVGGLASLGLSSSAPGNGWNGVGGGNGGWTSATGRRREGAPQEGESSWRRVSQRRDTSAHCPTRRAWDVGHGGVASVVVEPSDHRTGIWPCLAGASPDLSRTTKLEEPNTV
ncbi:hypothetical protein B0H16DRAFT_1892334 [Mycena metata]|uniref:Uncharacterized protein n=1 Tax=Mycena metata TaxID=1033252 RepID=A0AAD7MXE5_9AGAR|nr:hypothetical protein B0H16DRAFT_1892334 [Mycena metata]